MEKINKFDFKRKVLKNGMTILFEKRDVPVVSVAFALRCGGANEKISEKGIFHFIEHMLYKGTPSRTAKKIAEEIEKIGGELNGFTSESITAYWCKMPSRHLNVALDVLSDIVKNPLFDKKELEKERKVIFEEMKMYVDNPRMHVFDGIQGVLYEKPFGIPIIGTKESMNSVDREKIFNKFKEAYQPNNMILCVVGNCNFEELEEFAENNFSNEEGTIPKIDVKRKVETKIETRDGIDQANLVFGFPSPLADDKKNYASQILITLMADGLSSRLFQEIREKRNLAYAVKGYIDVSNSFSHSVIYVGTTKENVEKVKKLILEEFEKVAKSLDEKEFNEVKNQMIGQYQISMEDSQTQMVNLLASEINGDAGEYYEFEDNIRDVKLKDVRELAGQVGEGYSFFALVPKKN